MELTELTAGTPERAKDSFPASSRTPPHPRHHLRPKQQEVCSTNPQPWKLGKPRPGKVKTDVHRCSG